MSAHGAHLAPDLAGLRVLVTRPVGQSATLIAALRAAGADVISMPCVAIEARVPARLPERADAVVFISRNAVENGLAAGVAPMLRTAKMVLAVGPATAAGLAGFDVITPAVHSSDGLLELPVWDRFATGARVVIVKGCGGSTTLADGLRARGLVVDAIDTYERVAPPPQPAAFAAFSAAGPRAPVVLVSSVGIFENLQAMLSVEERDWLDVHAYHAPVSARIAAVLESRLSDEARSRIWRLDGAGVEAMVAGLNWHWRNARDARGKLDQ